MPAKQQDKQHMDQEKPERQQLNDVIGKYVMRALGEPGDLYLVQVRRLWGGRYRVNVLVGVDAASAKFAHSFFLVVDGDGNIVESTPEITRRY